MCKPARGLAPPAGRKAPTGREECWISILDTACRHRPGSSSRVGNHHPGRRDSEFLAHPRDRHRSQGHTLASGTSHRQHMGHNRHLGSSIALRRRQESQQEPRPPSVLKPAFSSHYPPMWGPLPAMVLLSRCLSKPYLQINSQPPATSASVLSAHVAGFPPRRSQRNSEHP